MIAILFILAAVAVVSSSSSAKLAHWVQDPSVDPAVLREGGSFDDTFALMRAPSGKGFARTITVAAVPRREGSLEAEITWSTRSGTQLCYAVRFNDDLILDPGSKLPRSTGDGKITWHPCTEGQNVIDSVKIGEKNYGPDAAYKTKVFVHDGRLCVQIFTPYDWRQTFMLHVRWEHTTRVE